VEVKRARFLSEFRRFRRVGLDTSTLIYHLEDVQPYSELIEAAFAAIAGGSPVGILSTISATELLVRPFAERQKERVLLCERFLLSFPNTVLIPPSYRIANEAARLRATYGIRTPDALLVATTLVERGEAFLTNDRDLRRLKAEGVAVLVLDEFV
jgi:predicted nucleic acid-binding protein